MKHRSSAKCWFLKTACAYLGTPYVWGGDDPSGFDCSGYVIECLKSAGMLKEKDDYTADGLLKTYKDGIIEKPERAALLFNLDNDRKAVHVTICLDEYFQIGASGGNHKTRDTDGAWRDNAYVKIRPISFNPARMRVVKLF